MRGLTKLRTYLSLDLSGSLVEIESKNLQQKSMIHSEQCQSIICSECPFKTLGWKIFIIIIIFISVCSLETHNY